MRTFATDKISTQGPRGFLASLAAAASQPLHETVTLTWLAGQDVTRVHCASLPCDWVELLEACIGNAGQADCEQVIVTVHTANLGEVMPYAAEVADLRSMVEPCGMGLLDALLVDGDRFWSYLCTDESCCPPQGTPIDGQVPPPVLLEPFTAEQVEQAAELIGSQVCDQAQAGWDALQALAAGEGDTAHHSAVVAAAMQQIDVRDYLMVMVRAAGTHEGQLARTLMAVAHAAPVGIQARVAAAAAMSLLASGSHPQPVRDLLAISGTESLARLVTKALDSGVPAAVAADSLDAAAEICIQQVTGPQAQAS